MTDTKLDQIARAIYERRNGHGCKPWSKLTKSHQVPYLDDARAAVEAMREPAECQEAPWRDEICKYVDEGAPSADLWRIGIDSILTEGKQT